MEGLLGLIICKIIKIKKKSTDLYSRERVGKRTFTLSDDTKMRPGPRTARYIKDLVRVIFVNRMRTGVVKRNKRNRNSLLCCRRVRDL